MTRGIPYTCADEDRIRREIRHSMDYTVRTYGASAYRDAATLRAAALILRQTSRRQTFAVRVVCRVLELRADKLDKKTAP